MDIQWEHFIVEFVDVEPILDTLSTIGLLVV